MTVHAFVDESERKDTYYLCAALVTPRLVHPMRKSMKDCLLPGQRELHFTKEKPPRRRALADFVAKLPVSMSIYRTLRKPTSEDARQRCVARMISDLREVRAQRLILDTREECDQHDKMTILRLITGDPWRDEFNYEHVTSQSEALIWIADVVGWCYGAEGDWRRRVMPIIATVTDV